MKFYIFSRSDLTSWKNGCWTTVLNLLTLNKDKVSRWSFCFLQYTSPLTVSPETCYMGERGRGRKRTILCFSDDFHSTARFMVFTFHGPVLGPTTMVIANAQSLLLSESSDQNYSLSRASSARSGSCNCWHLCYRVRSSSGKVPSMSEEFIIKEMIRSRNWSRESETFIEIHSLSPSAICDGKWCWCCHHMYITRCIWNDFEFNKSKVRHLDLWCFEKAEHENQGVWRL